MVEPSLVPPNATEPVYVVSTHIYRDALPDNPQVGDRVSGKLVGHTATHVRVICMEVDGDSRYGDRRWGCKEERYVIYYRHKPLKRLCSTCTILKSKSKFIIR